MKRDNWLPDRRAAAFRYEFVCPAIAQVIKIVEGLDLAGEKLAELHPPCRDVFPTREATIVHTEPFDGPAPNTELVEVMVFPANRGLDHGMQIFERDAARTSTLQQIGGSLSMRGEPFAACTS